METQSSAQQITAHSVITRMASSEWRRVRRTRGSGRQRKWAAIDDDPGSDVAPLSALRCTTWPTPVQVPIRCDCPGHGDLSP